MMATARFDMRLDEKVKAKKHPDRIKPWLMLQNLQKSLALGELVK